MIITLIILILEFVTAWKVFEKYGEAGWKAFIPFYNTYIEYGKVWFGWVGVLFLAFQLLVNWMDKADRLPVVAALIGLVLFVVKLVFSYKKSLAFGKGVGFAIVLTIIPFVGNLILGLGDAKYEGNKTV